MKRPLPSRPFQIISLDNGRLLLPRIFIQETLDQSFSVIGENTGSKIDDSDVNERRRRKYLYIGKNGQWVRAGHPYIQRVQVNLVNEKGQSHIWKTDQTNRFYLEFIKYKERMAFENFVTKNDFFIFPTTKEARLLEEEYRRNGLIRYFVPEKDSDDSRKTRLKIIQINIDFILKKQQELAILVKEYRNNTLTYDKLIWLNQQLEGMSYILIDKNHFLFEEITTGKEGKRKTDERTLTEVIGNIPVSEKELLPIARVYGHFAYCCYEFFLDILEKNKIAICPHCSNYFAPLRKGTFVCGNPTCKNKQKNLSRKR